MKRIFLTSMHQLVERRFDTREEHNEWNAFYYGPDGKKKSQRVLRHQPPEDIESPNNGQIVGRWKGKGDMIWLE